MCYEFRNNHGHIEVYDENGDFIFSADSMAEAQNELRTYLQVESAA